MMREWSPEKPTSKGAIRFQPDKPLPVRLVREIVIYRKVENAAGSDILT